MNLIIFFDSEMEAVDYRHNRGTGGWIFVIEDGKSMLYPISFTPSTIFDHPSTAGISGRLV